MAAKRAPAASPRPRSRERSRREIRISPPGRRQPDYGAGLRRRRTALGTLFVLLLALLGWGSRRFYLSRRQEIPAAESVEPAERALREAARQHSQDAVPPRNLGLYLLERQRPYEAMWAFADALDRLPGDAAARL